MAPALGALVKVAPSNPANGTACATPGVSRRILRGAADHGVGAGERGAGRQLQHGDQVSLVLVGDEAGGRADELPAGQPDEPGIDDQQPAPRRAAAAGSVAP